MYLLLNLSEKNIIHLALFHSTALKEKRIEGANRELLFCMDAFLKETQCTTRDIQGMMVVVGAGGFTSTRVSVIVANTFAYIYQIPLLAIDIEQARDPQSLIDTLLWQPKGQYILAAYSGLPHTAHKSSEEIARKTK